MKNHPHLRPYVEAVAAGVEVLDSQENKLKLLAAEERGFTPEELRFFEELRRSFVPREQVRPLTQALRNLLQHLDSCPRRETGPGGMSAEQAGARTQIMGVAAGKLHESWEALTQFLAAQPEENEA